jgi:hypothetical protein
MTEKENQRIRNMLKRSDVKNNRSELNSSLPNEHKDFLKKKISARVNSSLLFGNAQNLFERYCE